MLKFWSLLYDTLKMIILSYNWCEGRLVLACLRGQLMVSRK